jgi:hypothetical protein
VKILRILARTTLAQWDDVRSIPCTAAPIIHVGPYIVGRLCENCGASIDGARRS